LVVDGGVLVVAPRWFLHCQPLSVCFESVCLVGGGKEGSEGVDGVDCGCLVGIDSERSREKRRNLMSLLPGRSVCSGALSNVPVI